MNPEEAMLAHLERSARLSLAMHFGAFRLTDEAIDAPVRAPEEVRTRHGVGGVPGPRLRGELAMAAGSGPGRDFGAACCPERLICV